MKIQNKRFKYSSNQLQIEEFPDFTNVDFGNGYKVNFRKIGDSIIHCYNEGNMKDSNIERYYALFDEFVIKARIQKPYIEIRDLGNLKGRAPSREFQIQIKQLKDRESDMCGFIVCGAKGLVELVIKSAFRLVKTSMPTDTSKNLDEAIKKAIEFSRFQIKEDQFSLDNLIIDPRWCLKTSNYEVKNGIIPQSVFFTSLEGTFVPDDVHDVANSFEKVITEGNFQNREYIRIADYTKLPKVSFKAKTLYGKALDELNKKYQITPKTIILCGANAFNKAAMKIYSVATKKEIIFVDDVKEAFNYLNNKAYDKNKVKSEIQVNQEDIDEIINLGGSLIWGGKQRIDELVSEKNPLKKVAETLTVVQEDINELREKDREQNIILSESLDKMKILALELKKRDDETQQLNEELRATNDQLFAQKEELESAKIQLLQMNNNLENQVQERTEKLNLTVNRLNKSVSELDRFVYSASHDLSAPLKSMLGLLHIARKDSDKSHTDQYLDYLEKSIHNLEDVIKSLISYSRNSRLEVKLELIDLKKLVNEVNDELAFLPLAKSIQFKIEIPDGQNIISDRQRLKVILHNLINNSVKYADSEKPESYVRIKFDKNPEEYLITVEDNGIGIAEDQIEKIFEMFYRGTEMSKGSGLGLFIVKETIAALFGDIQVFSGSESTIFKVKLPANTIVAGNDDDN